MFQGAQEPMASSTGMKPVFLQFLAVDEIWPDKADPRFPALPRASPAHPRGRGGCPAHLPPHPATCVKWHVNYTFQVERVASWLPAEVIYLLEMPAGLFFSPFLPPSLLPLLLPNPHLAKQMKCQEEMSLRQVGSLWGISCTLIMVFVLWVVKFPSTAPVWS